MKRLINLGGVSEFLLGFWEKSLKKAYNLILYIKSIILSFLMMEALKINNYSGLSAR